MKAAEERHAGGQPSFERNNIQTFQRYKDYLFQPKIQISQLVNETEYPEDTEIVMMPYTANYYRSKTAEGGKRLSFKNIGYQEKQEQSRSKKSLLSR